MREASLDDKNPLKRRRGIRKIGPAVQVHSFELDSGVLERHADEYFSAGNKRIETFTTVQCPLFHVHLLHLCKSVREEQFVQSSGLHLNTFTCFNEDNSQTPPPLTFPVEKLKINRLNGLATRKQINQFRRLKVSNFRRRLFPSRRSSTTITLCWMAGSYSACSDCVFFGDQSQPKPMENWFPISGPRIRCRSFQCKHFPSVTFPFHLMNKINLLFPLRRAPYPTIAAADV